MKKGISLAAKAGIGVSIPLGVIAIVVILRVILQRKKKRQATTTPPGQDGPDNDHGKAELIGSAVSTEMIKGRSGVTEGYVEKPELPTSSDALDGGMQTVSLNRYASRNLVEMDGTSYFPKFAQGPKTTLAQAKLPSTSTKLPTNIEL